MDLVTQFSNYFHSVLLKLPLIKRINTDRVGIHEIIIMNEAKAFESWMQLA